MQSILDLHNKIHEIGYAIQVHTKPDGSPNFDIYQVFIALEVARRLITGEDKANVIVDAKSVT